jgi:RNA polymerase sigma-70 factor (ECF subfamily)
MVMDLDEAVDELAPRLLRYCNARTGDPRLAEDAAQDALTALVRRWRRQGPPDSPEAFVFAIARRRAVRVLIRQRMLVPLEAVLGRSDRHPDPERQVIEKRDRDALLSAMAALRPKDREALLLVAAGGLDTAGAARVLGISESAFKVRTFRARRRLAELRRQGNGGRGR